MGPIYVQLYLLAAVLFLAGKDATSYQLKEKTDNSLSKKRVQRWHRDGVALNILYVLPCYLYIGWTAIVYALLIRLSVFDIMFNKWVGFDLNYLGNTAWFDQVFGKYGALKKSLVFFLVLIAFNYLQLR